jgi:hypothetical protein
VPSKHDAKDGACQEFCVRRPGGRHERNRPWN